MDEMLDDLTDVYLSRCLKNWAAAQIWRNRSQAGASGDAQSRIRLLARAARIQTERTVDLFRARFWWNRRQSFNPEDPLGSEPFTQSRTWSLHQAESSLICL